MAHYVFSLVSQPIPAPILGTCVWGMLTLLSLSIWTTLREGMIRLQRLHQIPCDRCLYFTGDYRLKCTVNPYTAFTEEAIHCRDFESTSRLISACAQCNQHKSMNTKA